MGICSATSSTFLPYTQEQVYEFVTNPHNWPLTYKGSGGIQQKLNIPLKFGDKWTEKVSLPNNTYYSRWTLITDEKPSKWVFQQVEGIGAIDEELNGGVKGICTIEYAFEPAQSGKDQEQIKGTIFRRTLSIELPRGDKLPDDLLAVCMRTSGIEGYHDAVKMELDKLHSKL